MLNVAPIKQWISRPERVFRVGPVCTLRTRWVEYWQGHGNLAARSLRPRYWAYLVMTSILLLAAQLGQLSSAVLDPALGLLLLLILGGILQWHSAQRSVGWVPVLHWLECALLPLLIMAIGAPWSVLSAVAIGLIAATLAQAGWSLALPGVFFMLPVYLLPIYAPQSGAGISTTPDSLWLGALLMLLFAGALGQLGYRQTARLARVARQAETARSQAATLSARLARYVPQPLFAQCAPVATAEVLDGLGSDAPVNVQEQMVTVLFADLGGFTALSERLPTALVAKRLNRYLGRMAEIALAHGAVIDKFLGDGIMVFYATSQDTANAENANDANTASEHAGHALAMAQAMRTAAHELIGQWQYCDTAESPLNVDQPTQLHVRFGIATGVCMVGDFGTPERLDYTAIGPAVNLASRLESTAAPGEIVLDQTTYELLEDTKALQSLGYRRLRGIEAAVLCYGLAAAAS